MHLPIERTFRTRRRVRSSAARVVFAIVALSFLLLVSCRKAASPISFEQRSADQSPAAEPVVVEAKQEELAKPGGETARAFERKLVKDAELTLKVASYDHARRAIDQRLAETKGYLEDATVSHQSGRVSSANLVLRVPADRLDEFMRYAAGLGEVVHERVHTRDVTEEYYDAQARLANARRLEGRLLELIATKTQNVKDLLEVERELARVREQIETLEGKLRLFDSLVSYSKLVLRLTTEQRFEGKEPSTFGEQVTETFGQSLRALAKAARMGALVVVALVPWLLPTAAFVAIAFFVLRWLARSDRKRAREKAAKRAAGPPATNSDVQR